MINQSMSQQHITGLYDIVMEVNLSNNSCHTGLLGRLVRDWAWTSRKFTTGIRIGLIVDQGLDPNYVTVLWSYPT